MSEYRFFSLWRSIGIMMLIGVIVASLLPVERMPHVGGSDKFHHGLSYFALTFWFVQLYRSKRISLALSLIAMGLLIEFLQPRISNRYFEWADFFANSCGVGLAMIVLMTPLRNTLAWFDRLLQRGLT
jgi:VanZ family protein